MLIDFHTHSTASDGELPPAALLERARERGIRCFAITDHDTVGGYLAVRDSAAAQAMTLVSGVEFSCRWSGVTVHIVGLGMDVDHTAMRAGLSRLAQARQERAAKIAQRLEKLGFAGALAGAEAEAGDSQLGRPHFAAWMVAEGHAEGFNDAFDRYLGQGKTGDVKAFWPELAEVVQWIVAAGGTAVIAHPLKYKLTRTKLQRLVLDFKRAGGTALELVNGRQNPDQTATLRRLALECDLAVSAGSDFHRDSAFGPDLGVEFRAPEGLDCLGQHFLAEANT
ncbi:PHP domain-containing protein [Parahaliea mediterranea]|uniref:PHP domain-containing protein n=1 Tax=Parahaliea mediterranea TaxID=651086 RepID=UPI000E2E973D|nr:PHP domain-containing protein [Parahaliea mediterranea]